MPTIMPIRDMRNTSAISELAHKQQEPIFITKNGYSDLVVMSAELYNKFALDNKIDQAIYGKLVNSATGGLSTIQKLGINEDSLSEEELQKAANLPAMIYYGVNSDEAILMRMNNVPRSMAAEMGVEYKKDFANIYKQYSYEIRQWIEGLSSDKWDVFAENKREMSGSDYRAIWEVLNNES